MRLRARTALPQCSTYVMRKANDMGKQHEILHMPHEQIEQIQLEGLKKTVVNVYENVPFYKNLFDEAGFDPYAVQTLADLQKAPFTTKQDLRDNYPYNMFAVPMKDVREIHMSSGTTGIATVGGYTEHDIDIWSDCFARGIEYADGGEDDICHVCYGYGLFTGGLGAHYGCMKAGCTTIPMSAGNTERQIRILREMGSTILCCTPSYAMHIADTAISMMAVNEKQELVGGVILPGPQLSLETLVKNTAQLPQIDLAAGTPASILGKSTSACLQNGFVLGTASQLDGLAARFCAELSPQTAFYATGNLPRAIRDACRTPIRYRETLITDGLYRIWQKNRKG